MSVSNLDEFQALYEQVAPVTQRVLFVMLLLATKTGSAPNRDKYGRYRKPLSWGAYLCDILSHMRSLSEFENEEAQAEITRFIKGLEKEN